MMWVGIAAVAIIIAALWTRYKKYQAKKTTAARGAPPIPPAAPAAGAAGSTGNIRWYRVDKHVSTWSEGDQKAVLFAVWTILLYVAAISLHKEAGFLLSFKWFGILLLLLTMVAVLCKGVELLKGSWFTMIVFVLLTVAVFDPGLIRNFPEEFKDLYHSAGGCPSKAPTSGEVLGAEWKEFNPNGCDTQVAVTSGVVLLNGPGLSRPLRVKAGDYTIAKDTNVAYTEAKAEGDSALWFHMECDRGHRIVGEWKCR